MKNYIVFFLIIALKIYSQNISGKVTNAAGLALSGASVYLEGTTIGTQTDENGSFQLKAESKVNALLIVRLLGYQDFIISNPYKMEFYSIELKLKEKEIDPIIIFNDGFTRKQKLEIFRKQFLGDNKEGKACKILNEDALILQYDKKTFQLNASSYEPIIIENDYLGYKIEFDLYEFYIKFHSKSIKSEAVVQSMFLGTSKFTDVALHEYQIKNRNKVYEGSSRDFFRTIIENTWKSDHFLLYEGRFAVNASNYFKIEPQEGFFKIIVKEKNDNFNNSNNIIFSAYYNLLFKKKRQSSVNFHTEEFYVDSYGNSSHGDQIVFGGDIGAQKIGCLLPLNFMPFKN